MKNFSIKGLFLLMMCLIGTNANAQSLGSLLSKVTGSSAIGDVVSSLIGTSTISESSIKGTWKYNSPAVAFESDNLLATAGGTAISSTIEKKLQTKLNTVGIKKGSFSITFNTDKTFSCTLKGKTVKGTYSISGANIKFYSALTKKEITTANAKVGSTLQLTFKADKLLDFVNQVGGKINNNTINQISGIAKNYKGMQIGMKFSK